MNLHEHICATIQSFENKRLPFHAMVSELDAAIDGLPDTYPQKKTLRAEWWTLEQTNAVMLEQEVLEISPSHGPLVRDTIMRIKQILSDEKC